MLELLLASAIVAGTPLLYATLGEIITERSGVLNLGVEGMMTFGALSGFAITVITGNLAVGLVSAGLSAGLLSLIHAFLCVTLKANQVISGLGLTIFGIGISSYLGKALVGTPVPVALSRIELPLLKEIPLLGPVLFQHNILVYLAVLTAIIIYYVFNKTRAGIYLKAVGDDPAAADMAGINVFLVRYLAIMCGGILCGVGGAYISLVYTPFWTDMIISGRGWIAIALVIFSAWDPRLAIAGAFLFGSVDALATRFQVLGINIPPYFLRMLPYVFTIVIMILSSKRSLLAKKTSSGPAALTLPYQREG